MKRIFILCVTCLFVLPSLAQEGEDLSCKCCNNNLAVLLEGKILKELYVNCGSSGNGTLASSFLMPSGKPPVVATPLPGDAPDYSALEAWTCTYAPGKVNDGDVKTAWVEGKSDYGLGELLLVTCLDLKKPVQIWAGYGKSAAHFAQNSRPKKIKTFIIQADTPGHTQYGTWYHNLKVVAEAESELRDENQYQKLSVPPFDVVSYYPTTESDAVDYHYFLGIQLIDVVKGSKWSDTCISEVKNGASTPEELGSVVFEAFKNYNFDILECVIPTMNQVAEKSAQYGAPMSTADLKNAEAVYDMVKTEYKSKCLELHQKGANHGNGIDWLFSKTETITTTEKEYALKDGKKITMTAVSIPVVSNNKKVTLVLNKVFQLHGTWYVTPGDIELIQH